MIIMEKELQNEIYTFEKCKVEILLDGTIKTSGDCELTHPEINAIVNITNKIREQNG